jgi:predicted ATPase/class 3 adenylate cyclase
VTALFSDLSGYTAMSEKLDPEEVKEITSRIFGEIAQVVAKYEGFIEKFVGDAVMALFGVPKAHEDDPVRAIRAAREIHDLVESLSPQIEEKVGQAISMHSGINTGLVVTGEVDLEKGTHGLTGDAINLASRLSSIAKADEILVGQATYRQAEGYFVFEPLKPTKLKGKAEPIIPSRVVGETKAQTRFEAVEERGFIPYTGRKQELSVLQGCIGEAMTGKGQFVTVVGEAGIGKSRLLFELRHSLDRDRVTLLQGRCQSYGTDTPYLPFVNALRRGLDLREDDSPAQLLEKAVTNILAVDSTLEPYLPHYLHLLSIPNNEYSMPKNLRGEELRKSLQKALAAILILNTQHKPMVLILEDWHWADEASDLALRHLVSMIPSYPLMLVVLYRPEYKASWESLEIHTPLVLKALGRPNTEDIVKSIFNADGLPEGLGEMIHGRTGGNPLFIEELANSLVEQRAVLVKKRQAALTQSVEDLQLPDTVQAVISSRFDRLDGKAQETLRLASVIGREFAKRTLERITPTREELSKPLEDLKALEVIQQIRVLPEAEYIFKHVLTQVVVYDSLLLQRRKELHGLVGKAIEEFYANRLEEHYEALAHHYSNSAYPEKAIHYLELAGDKATKYFSLGEARKHYRIAIEFLDSLENSSETKDSYIELSLKWAEVSHYAPSEEHVAILEMSRHYAQELKDEKRQARTMYWIGRMHYALGKMRKALPLFERCIGIGQATKDDELLALPYNIIGRMCFYSAEFKKGIDYLEKGIPIVERLGNHEETIYSLSFLAMLYVQNGNFSRGHALISKALQLARDFNSRTWESLALGAKAHIHARRGEWNASRQAGALGSEISNQIGNPVMEGIDLAFLGYATFMEGEREAGLKLMLGGIDKIESAGSRLSLSFFYNQIATISILHGRIADAVAFAEKALEGSKTGDHLFEEFAYFVLAKAATLKTSQDWDIAQEHMNTAVRIAGEQNSMTTLAEIHYRYAEILAEKGDIDKAREQVDKATSLFSEMQMTWWLEQAQKIRESL